MQIQAEFQPLNRGTGTRVPIRVCSADDRRVTAADGQIWWPAIVRRPALNLQLFDGDFVGQIRTGAGQIALAAYGVKRADPSAPAYDWAAAPARFWTVDPATGTRTLVFDGLVERITNAGEALTVELRVDTEPFVQNALTLTYAGTGGIEGPTDLTGKVKPLLLGRCFNVEPALINATDNVYQVSAYGLIEAVTTLYERGSAFGASIGDYANYAALVAAAIPPGGWATCLASGLIRLGAPAYGVITADVDGDKPGGVWLRKTGEIINRLCSIASVPSGSIDSASLAALDTALAGWPNQGRIGLYLTDQRRLLDLLQELVRPCNAQAGISWLGKLFVCRTVIGTPAVVFDAQARRRPAVASVAEQSVSPPYWRIEMQGARSWRVHSDAEIAQGALPANEVAGLRILPSADGFTFTDGIADPGGQSITLDAVLTGVAGTATWSTTPSVTLGGSGNTRTLSVAAFGTNRQVTVEATLGGITDRITLVRLERNIAAPANANLVPFTRFEGGRGWAVAPSSTVASFTPVAQIIFENRFFIQTDATASAGDQDLFLISAPDFAVLPSSRLSVQARVDGFALSGPAPLFWQFRIEFYNQSGFVSSVAIATGTGKISRDTLQQAFVDVPSTANRARLVMQSKSGGTSVMRVAFLEPMVAYAAPGQTVHPPYTPGPNAEDGATVGATAAQVDLINSALTSAANAQATADGKIETYYQATPPAGSEGDLWFDTDDGYRQYRFTSGAWFLVSDNRIGEAITAAAGAQATADGKVTTFTGESAPTAEGVGDLWYKPSLKTLHRWTGATWAVVSPIAVQDGADVTAGALPELPQGDLFIGASVTRGQTWNYFGGTWVAKTNFIADAGNYPPNSAFWNLFNNAADSSRAVAVNYVASSSTFGQAVVADVRAGPLGRVDISCILNVVADGANSTSYIGGGKWRRETTPGSGSYTDVMTEVTTGLIAPGGSTNLDTSVSVTGLTPGALYRFDLQLRRPGAGPGSDVLYMDAIANLQGL